MELSEIARSINRAFSKLPPELGALPEDVKLTARLLAQKVLSEMDFVTREEFEVQQQVLHKTRMKLADLEARVAALEAAAEGGRAAGEKQTGQQPDA